MKKKRTIQETIEWLKAAQKRQQDWQQEVKRRWTESRHPYQQAQRVARL